MKQIITAIFCSGAIATGCKTQQKEERFDASKIQSVSLDANQSAGRIYVATDTVYIPPASRESIKY